MFFIDVKCKIWHILLKDIDYEKDSTFDISSIEVSETIRDSLNSIEVSICMKQNEDIYEFIENKLDKL